VVVVAAAAAAVVAVAVAVVVVVVVVVAVAIVVIVGLRVNPCRVVGLTSKPDARIPHRLWPQTTDRHRRTTNRHTHHASTI